MNIKDYAELKEGGDLVVKEIEGQVRAVKKNYNPNNGKLLSVDILPIDKVSLLKQEQDALELATAIRAFVDDVEALEPK